MKIVLSSFIILFTFIFSCLGQNIWRERNFEFLQKASDQIDPHINAITQDQKGYIWIATENGLYRYDGFQVNTYKYLSRDSLSLPHNRVLDLQVDRQGKLWVATSGGLAMFNETSNNFKPVYTANKKVTTDIFIQSVDCDEVDNIWFSTSARLWKFDPVNQALTSFELPKDPSILEQPYLHTLACGAQNKIYLSIHKSLYEFSEANGLFSLIYKIPAGESDMILKIAADTLNTIWTCTRNGQLHKYSISEKKYARIYLNEPTLRNHPVSNVYLAKNGSVLFVMDKLGIGYFDENTGTVKSFNYSYFKFPQYQGISCLFQDQQNILWVGHQDIGLSYALPFKNFQVWDNQHYSFRDLQSNVCISVLADSNNQLWIGNDGGGLHIFKPEGFCRSLLKEGEFSPREIMSFYEDTNQQIWVGTYSNGIYILNRDGAILNHYYSGNGLPGNDVRKVVKDKNGIYWIATHGRGVTSYDPEKKIFENYSSYKNAALAPGGDWTFDLSCDKYNQLWIASNRGLSVIDSTRKKINHFLHDNTNTTSIVSNELRCLLIDSSDKIWCGTLEGISIYNQRTGKFIHVLPGQGVLITSLVESNDGHIWAGTDIGLLEIAHEGNIIRKFTKADGLPSNSFLINAVTKCKDGSLIVGSTNGLVKFNPAKLQFNTIAPGVEISEVRNNEIPVLYAGGNSINDSNIEFPFNENNISFYLTAFNLINAQNNSFAYRLLGFDSAWKNSTERKIVYPNLPPGNYRFEAKSLNNDGVWSETLDAYTFSIRTPWWKSPIAYFIYILAVIGTLYLIYYFMKIRIQGRTELLLAESKNRALNELYEAKLNFFTNISHDIRTPLSLIYGPVETLLHAPDLSAKNKKLLELIHRNTRHLLKMINELLEFKKIEAGKTRLQPELINLNLLLSNLVEDYKLPAFQKDIQLTLNLPVNDFMVYTHRRFLERAIQNVLANAFKFTPLRGQVEVTLSQEWENQKLLACICIKDTGPGIENDKLEKVFERFYEGKNSEGSGLGLYIVKNLLEEIGGRISVSNNNGAEFRFYLPMETDIFPSVSSLNHHTNTSERTRINSRKSSVVLIIEDNKELRTYLAALLNEFFTVIQAEDGVKGFEMATSATPDLIVSDVMMPELDGISLCTKLKSSLQTSHIPIIILTAQREINNQRGAMLAGADDFISKPFSTEMLLLKISNMLETQVKNVDRSKIRNKILDKNGSDSPDAKFIEDFKKIVALEYGNPELSMELLCENLGLSRSQLYKKIQNLMGCSPMDYIQEVRLREAMELLHKTSLNVSEVAYKVGYNDPRYFSSRFKRFVGSTPSEYQEQVK